VFVNVTVWSAIAGKEPDKGLVTRKVTVTVEREIVAFGRTTT
jgi:hypothetical protein